MGSKKRLMPYAIGATFALGLLSSSQSVAGDHDRQEPTGSEMFLDAVVVRPMTLTASAVGLVAWVVTLPFTIPSGGAADAGKSWVADPLEYTFVRPLGDISDNR